MERLPFWGQVLVMLLLAVLIVAAAYYVYPNLGAMGQEIQGLRNEYLEKERKIAEGRAIEQKLPEFEREIATLQRRLGDVQTILPTSTETGELLRWIKNLADQSNLDLKVFAPGALRPQEFYREFPIEMDVVGNYHDLGVFLDRVSKYSRIINVDNLRINTNREAGSTKSIRSTFSAVTFVYDEAADRP
jgi:type IV pilus assembly protein PilO